MASSMSLRQPNGGENGNKGIILQKKASVCYNMEYPPTSGTQSQTQMTVNPTHNETAEEGSWASRRQMRHQSLEVEYARRSLGIGKTEKPQGAPPPDADIVGIRQKFPTHEAYDEAMQSSFLMPLFPLFFGSTVATYIVGDYCRQILPGSTDRLSILLLCAMPTFLYLFFRIVFLARRASFLRQCDENAIKECSIPCMTEGLPMLLSSHWFWKESLWMTIANHIETHDELAHFPFFWLGHAPSWYIWNHVPVTVSVVLCCASQYPVIIEPLALATVWISSWVALNLGLCCGWVPTDTAIKHLHMSLGALKMGNKSAFEIRSHVQQMVNNAMPDWHEKQNMRSKGPLLEPAGIAVSVAVLIMWMTVLGYNGVRVSDIDTSSKWCLVVFSALSTCLTIKHSVMSFLGVFVMDLTACMQICLMRQEFLTDLLQVDKIPMIIKLGEGKIMAGFESWLVARTFIERHDCNFPFAGMSPYFGMQMILAAIGILGVFLMQIAYASPFVKPLYWCFFFTAVVSTLCALATGVQIVAINFSVDRQARCIDDHLRLLAFDVSTTFVYKEAIKTECDTETFTMYLQDFRKRLHDLHVPPKVLGIFVKPTVFIVFQGYVVAGISSIIIQYVTSRMHTTPAS